MITYAVTPGRAPERCEPFPGAAAAHAVAIPGKLVAALRDARPVMSAIRHHRRRSQLATCGSPGLYLHIPEQDISGWRQFSLAGVMAALAAVDAALAAGATKTMALRGLWGASKLVDKVGIDIIAALEARLAQVRGSVEFSLGAVIA